MCGVRCGPPFILLPWEFQLSQHQLLKRLFFFSSNRLGVLVETDWLWVRMFISGLSMPFH